MDNDSIKNEVVDKITLWAERIMDDIDMQAQSDAEKTIVDNADIDAYDPHILDSILPINYNIPFFNDIFAAYQELYEYYCDYYTEVYS